MADHRLFDFGIAAVRWGVRAVGISFRDGSWLRLARSRRGFQVESASALYWSTGRVLAFGFDRLDGRRDG